MFCWLARLFHWLARYIRRIDVMGVGVELRDPASGSAVMTSSPPASDPRGRATIESGSPPDTVVGLPSADDGRIPHSRKEVFSSKLRAEWDDPRTLLGELISAYKAGDVSRILDNKTTKVGRRVLGWLVEQKWFDERPPLLVTEKKVEGERSELVGVYRFQDGIEKVALVFFWEDGALKFHDVCCFDMKGDRVNMFLSFILDNPIKAKAFFALQNPGKPLRRMFGT